VALTVGLNAKSQVNGLVADHAIAANLDAQRIEENDRIHGFQRAALPGDGFGHDFVGHGTDEVRRNLRAVALGEKPLNLAYAHAPGVHGDNAFIKSGKSALVLRNKNGLEAAVAIPGEIDANGAAIRNDCLAARTVALIGLLRWLGFTGPVAQVQVHLRTHGPFDDRLVESL